jgi:hypothetical protein
MVSFGLLSSTIIPVIFVSLAKFPTYYTWMVFVPAAVCVCSTLATMRIGRLTTRAIGTGLALACLAGLPLQLMAVSYDWQDRDHARVVETIAADLTKDDWVLCESQAYFAVKPTAARVFLADYIELMTSDEKRQVTVLIGSEETVREWCSTLGGEWRASPRRIVPQRMTIVERITGKNMNVGLIGEKYNLAIYRRQPAAASVSAG